MNEARSSIIPADDLHEGRVEHDAGLQTVQLSKGPRSAGVTGTLQLPSKLPQIGRSFGPSGFW